MSSRVIESQARLIVALERYAEAEAEVKAALAARDEAVAACPHIPPLDPSTGFRAVSLAARLCDKC